jgi:predicted GNAT family acetyltransferase
MTDDTVEIEHGETPAHGEFTIGRLAVLTYRKAGAGHIVVNHTRVADEARGQGLAAKLYKALVRHARAHDLKVSSTCSYVSRMFERFPEDRDVLQD